MTGRASPIGNSSSTLGQSTVPVDEAALINITEGYYRFTDIVWNWAGELDPWESNAVAALVNTKALVDPFHPLREEGKEGIEMYICYLQDGSAMFCFSLKQIEYLQEYIYEMRLADPIWVTYLGKLAHLSQDEVLLPPEARNQVERIPLPTAIVPMQFFTRIEPKCFLTSESLKSTDEVIRKGNKTIAQNQHFQTMSPDEQASERLRLEAVNDNNTPGPGLRRGPPRENNPQRDSDDRPTGTGWGGVTLPKSVTDLPPTVLSYMQVPTGGSNPTSDDLTIHIKDVEDSSRNNVGEQDRLNCDVGTRIETENAVAEHNVTSNKHPERKSDDEILERYFTQAQQAAILASQGGVLGVLSGQDGQMEVGRSLFIALQVTASEDDHDDILEVGYSAVWWAVSSDSVDAAEQYHEMKEDGLWIVQDNIGLSRAIRSKPSVPYAYGDFLCIPFDELYSVTQRKILDLWKQAGLGPIYMIINSTGQSESAMAKVGLDVARWERELHPAGWEFPSYSSDATLGRTFVIDTARLFGVIEYSLVSGPAPANGASHKSLEQIVHGLTGYRVQQGITKNAGNYAHLNCEMFMTLVSSSIDEMRDALHRNLTMSAVRQLATKTNFIGSVTPATEDSKSKEVNRAVILQPGDDEEYDSDFADVTGVYYENHLGELVAYESD